MNETLMAIIKSGDNLSRYGYYNHMLAMGFEPGIPDLWIVTPDGRVKVIECKSPRGKVSPAQVAQIERLKRCGVEVFVCRGWGDFQDWINENI